MFEQSGYKNILCIRADNMGDVIMASPAMRALRDSFGSKITLLTSKAGGIIAPYLNCIDDSIIFNLPWVQSTGSYSSELLSLVDEIRGRNFDAAVIFTVYSQSSLPAAMLAYLAEIPVRVAYARENPYELLTHWIPDPEPYQLIRHQVERDLALAVHLGAEIADDAFHLKSSAAERDACERTMSNLGITLDEEFLVIHPGVSEEKRQYPADYWVQLGKDLIEQFNVPVLVTGSATERELAERIALGIGNAAVAAAGHVSLGEFICLISHATAVISVNTGTIHIAAATKTPVVVLYAQTNPQHTPWKSHHRIIEYSVPHALRSKNGIIQYVSEKLYKEDIPFPEPAQVLAEVKDLLKETQQ